MHVFSGPGVKNFGCICISVAFLSPLIRSTCLICRVGETNVEAVFCQKRWAVILGCIDIAVSFNLHDADN